jgi:hypothetical protein
VSKAAKLIAAVVVTVAAVVTLDPNLIRAAIAMDTALIVDAATPKQKVTSAGQETKWSANPRDGIPYPVGRCATAGNQVFMRSAPANSGNKYRNYVTVYGAGGPMQALEGFYANDVLTPFTADGGEGASGYYLNRMWLKTQLGTANSPYLHWTATGSKDTPADHGGMPAEWSADHRLSGYAASLWGLEWDTTRYAGGVPAPKMVGSWVKVYDPRKDSTYPGGAGPHRYAEPSDKAAYLAAMATWEWSANPYLHGLMWALGRWTGDPAYPAMPLVKTHGLGAPLSVIDVASFVEGANVAQANAWTLGGVVKSTDDKWEVLKQFLEAGGGEPILLGHKLACMVNAPKVSLATLTKADAIGDVSVAGAVAIEDRLNTIWPSYTEETQNWTVVPFDTPVQVAAYLAPDKGVRSTEMSLPLVQSPVQMAQLARYRIEDSRELTPIVIPAKPWTMWLRPGDCITANEPEWGLNGQKLLIMQRKRDPATMKVTFICRTETDGKHAFALGQTATPPDTPALTGIDASIVPLPAGDAFAIIDGQVAGPGGSLPAIVLHGEADLYDAVTIVVDYRRVLPEPVGEWKSKSFPASATTLVVDGVEAGARYQVRIRYITAKGVENPDANTDLGEIVVGGVDAGSVAGKPAQEVVDDLAANFQELARQILILQNFVSYQEALNYDGDGTSTKLVALDAIAKAATAIQRMALLAAVAPGGLSMILNAATAIADSDHTIGTLASIVTSTLGDGTITVSQIMEAIDGQAGRIAFAVNSGDQVVGLDLGIRGNTAYLDLVSPNVRFIDPDGVGGPLVVLSYSNALGKWTVSTDVAIDGDLTITGTLTTPKYADNSVIVPVVVTASSAVYCDGTDKVMISGSVTLPYPGTIYATNFLAPGFPSGDKTWTAKLFIDGDQVFTLGTAANAADSMALGGSAYRAAGTYLVEVTLNSHSSVFVGSRTLNIQGIMK